MTVRVELSGTVRIANLLSFIAATSWHSGGRERPRALPRRDKRVKYYFHINDGEALLDDEGLEFSDFNTIKAEALRSCVDMIKDIPGNRLWSGTPWTLWVTDQPNGGGSTVLTLTLSARLSA